MSVLSLDNNKLTGAIPDTIGELSRLSYLVLDNNQLTGILPESVFWFAFSSVYNFKQ